MNNALDEQRIVEITIEQFQNETGLRITFDPIPVTDQDGDGVLHLLDTGKKLKVEVKKWAANATAGNLVAKMQQIAEPGNGVLIADYIDPRKAEKLKEAKVQFLDTAGNAYLNQPPIYVFITGKKPAPQTTNKRPNGKAFQPTGMKIIYAFLINKALVNAPYRDIAKQAGVALGAVGMVIRDLVERGLLDENKQLKQRQLTNYNQLLDEWTEAYPQKLRKKQFLGNFTTDNDHWWQTLSPRKYGAVWGGEIAAADYTHYLTPKDATLYIPKGAMNLFLKEARLRRIHAFEAAHINIDLFEPFWNYEDKTHGDMAHPVLVYADLIASDEPRNIETAQKLRDQYIR
tara:strand:- start:3105 stop:4136 length:1032 start_codon:yes stop_codon:yes gene_type:complete